MPRNLDIALLRAFAAVADRRSMTAAAEALHLTQGAVSQQIARLEALAGGPLMLRERPALRLTPAGERLLGKARQLVALNDAVWTELEGGELAGPVRLGVPHDLLGGWFAPALKRFAAACPDVDLSLRSGASVDLAHDLAAGRLDLAVSEAPLGEQSGELLAVDRLVWVGAPGGAAHRRTPLPVSIAADVCVFRPAVLAALDRHGSRWRTVSENGGPEAAFATVRADLAISAWLASAAPPDLDLLPPAAGLPNLPAFAITLQGAGQPAAPAVAELARHIRDHFARRT